MAIISDSEIHTLGQENQNDANCHSRRFAYVC